MDALDVEKIFSDEYFKKMEANDEDWLLKNLTRQSKDGIITLKKHQLLNPALQKILENDKLQDILGEQKLSFVCADGDLVFNIEETKKLAIINDIIEHKNGELKFEEYIQHIGYYSTSHGKIKYYKLEYDKVLRTFTEVLEINKKLNNIAKFINEATIEVDGKEQQLSPAQKYLLCYIKAEELQYYTTKNQDYDPASSLIDTVRENKGCCMGKSEYLHALLSLVGIKSCTISLDSKNEELNELVNFFENNPEARITYEDELEGINYKFKTQIGLEEARQKIENRKQTLDNRVSSNHQIILIWLDDDRFDIHGLFAADSTGCLYDKTTNLSDAFIKLNDDLFNFATFYNTGKNVLDLLNSVQYKPLSRGDEYGKKIENEYSEITKKLKYIRNNVENNVCSPNVKQEIEDATLYKIEQAIEARTKLENAPRANVLFDTINEIGKSLGGAGLIRAIKDEKTTNNL